MYLNSERGYSRRGGRVEGWSVGQETASVLSPSMANAELLARITARPDVFGGKPIIRDMRISGELILSLLA